MVGVLLVSGCGIKPYPIYRSFPKTPPPVSPQKEPQRTSARKTPQRVPATQPEETTPQTPSRRRLTPHAQKRRRTTPLATTSLPTPTVSHTSLQHTMDSFLGTPYAFGGTTKRGIDCSSLVQQVYRQATGIVLPRTAAGMYQQGKKISQRHLQFGDLVFFGRSVTQIDHVGIYSGNQHFFHASSSRGVIYSELSEKYFRRRYRGAIRITQ